MSNSNQSIFANRSFAELLEALRTPKLVMMLILGFTAGMPLLLYFSTLSVWLTESKVEKAIIGFFSWFGLAYSLKFLWAPIIDNFDPPGFARIFGRRRAWILVAQIGLVLALLGMGFSNPSENLGVTALFSFLIAFTSASQDVGIDAWRIEAASNDDEQATLAGAYQYGYRIGLVVAGGAALVVAGVTNFQIAYWTMAGVMLLGAVVFAIWDRKYGVRAAVAGGVLLLAFVLPGKINLSTGIQEFISEFSFAHVFSIVSTLAVWVCGLIFAYFVYQALRDGAFREKQSLTGTLLGVGFAAVTFLALTIVASAFGIGVRLIVGALGIEFDRKSIDWLVLGLAATPLVLCAVAVPLIRGLPRSAPVMTHPTWSPFIDFFWKHGWIAVLILTFVSSYRLSDIVMGVMAKPAYTDIGYTAANIGVVSGTYGPWVVIVGVALAGISALKIGLRASLIIGAVVSVLGNLTFAWLVNQSSESLFPLFVAVTADNLAGGYSATIFVAFLSSLVTKSFAGTQYAIFSSAYTLGPKLLAGTSGIFVESYGYQNFFLYAAVLGIPAILLSFMTFLMRPDRE